MEIASFIPVVLQAIYYTVLIIITAFSVSKLISKSISTSNGQVVEALAKVIDTAVIKTKDHDDHRRRLTDLEAVTKAHARLHSETNIEAGRRFDTLENMMSQTGQRIDDLFKVLAKGKAE